MKKSKSSKVAPPKKSADRSEPEDFLIVGIGASAGGINALKQFFEKVTADSGIAYVVILHLSPDYDSQLAAILQTVTSVPVTQVSKRVHIEPNHVYVVPPNRSLKMIDGFIIVSPINTVEERRAPVDIFFRTLAESKKERAVAVILSGTGANGSMGVKRVKETGGVIFVQNPKEAEYSDMPRNSLATGLVDDVLPAADIPAKILAYKSNSGKVRIPPEPHERAEADEQSLREIFTQLRVKTGHDFSNYKRATVLRRIERRINVRELDGLAAYALYIREQPTETEALLRDLLISVTNFFRDGIAFEKLEHDILPRILEGKTVKDAVRVWVAGCATGEEAYSLAMLLAEKTFAAPYAPKVQIFATDIDENAIAYAREGFYTLNDAADISPERLNRFFTKEGDGFRVRREIREMILFAAHNLIKDAPFSQLDLATCRNLLIYLNRTAQTRVMEIMHFAIKPNGYLFLGSSESTDGAGDLFAPVSKENNIFQSRPVNGRTTLPVPDLLPVLQFNQRPAAVWRGEEKRVSERLSYTDLHQQLLEEYASPSLIVNAKYDILHLSERVGRYLQITGGEPTFNLLKVIRRELRLELRTALYQAVQRNTNVEAKNLKIEIGGATEAINIHVRPILQENDAARGFILVLFETAQATEETNVEILGAGEPVAQQLEEELVRTKSRLQATTEQYETQTEEYKASNEELQAINEELRSAAEELETGKEELQSLNEELTTVNQELKIKIEEISQSNNDFQNLINSTDVGTIFLDRNFRVNFFSPAARHIFNLIAADIGRELSDITSHLENNDLMPDAKSVLKSLQPLEREIRTVEGRLYLMKIQPYRTSRDSIDGVVITFFNTSDLKKAEKDLRESVAELERQSRIFDTTLSSITDFAYTFDKSGRFVYANRPLLEMLDIAPEEIVGKNFFDLNYPSDLATRLQRQIQHVFKTAEMIRDETPFTAANLENGFYEYIFCPVIAADGSVELVAGSTRDITERKRREANLAFLAEISYELSLLTGVEQIMQTVGAKIGAYFNLSVCAFIEINETENEAVINHAWSRPDVPDVIGNYRLSDYVTGEFQEAGRAGKIFAVADTQTDSRTDATHYAALKIGSFLSVPLIKNGKWRFLLVNYHSEPHDWLADEIELISELTTRIWTIVDRAYADGRLRESKERLQMLIESAADYAIMTLTIDGIIDSWNAGAEKVFGYREDEIIGQPSGILFTPEDRAAKVPEKEMKVALDQKRAEDERWHLRKDGSRFYVSGVLRPLEDGEIRGFVKIARDMTDKIQAEKVERERETLKKLVGAQEGERKRLARDLHDHLGQQLTALHLKLEAMRRLCKEDEICAKIDESQLIARQIDSDVTFIAWELRPAALDDLGLVAALENYISEWSHHSGVTAELHTSGLSKTRLLPEVEINLYRIAQEALNNIYKHANAKFVAVMLRKVGKEIVLIIEDNGIGFDVEDKTGNGDGLGLLGMRERAALVGGTQEIESAVGVGTTVFVRVHADSGGDKPAGD